MSVEEYFIYEASCELRHEFIHGNLYEMSGASREHHQICKKLLFFFENLLAQKGCEIFIENMKVQLPGEEIFLYPDILVTKETQTANNRYAQHSPELLAEVVSETTCTRDMVDKLLMYQKFSSLKYYLILEQDKPEITIISKDSKGSWQSETVSGIDAVVHLPLLDASLHLNKIYS